MNEKKLKKLSQLIKLILVLTIIFLTTQLWMIKNDYQTVVKDFNELRDSLSQEGDRSYEELSLIVDSTYGVQAIEHHLKNKETFVFVLGSETCHYCQIYKEDTLDHYDAEQTGVTLLEIDMNYAFLFEEDLTNFVEGLALEYIGTPTTVFVKDGVVVEEYAGPLSMEELVEKIEKIK